MSHVQNGGRIMAKVLGESGRYTSQQAAKKSREIRLVIIAVIGVLGVIEGFCLSNSFPVKRLPWWIQIIISIGGFVGALVAYKFGSKRWDKLDKERENMRRGATGEILVGQMLADFPDDFRVINGLSTPFGDLDHVVVGPTGVFVLDSKNWRGVVANDGKGELLLNDKATDKPYIRQFVGRMMKVREKVVVLAPQIDVFYNAVFVFTSARVEAKWGTTGNVNCITADQLHSYILEKDFGKKLQPEEVDAVAQAFLGLAHMDKEFSSRPSR